MSRETLTDPVLGTLVRLDEAHWEANVSFTPKHPVRVVVINGLIGPVQPPEVMKSRARGQYLEFRQREWEYRVATARAFSEDLAAVHQFHLTILTLFANGVMQAYYDRPDGNAASRVLTTILPDRTFFRADLVADLAELASEPHE